MATFPQTNNLFPKKKKILNLYFFFLALTPGSPLGLIRIQGEFWMDRFQSPPNFRCGESNTMNFLPCSAPITNQPTSNWYCGKPYKTLIVIYLLRYTKTYNNNDTCHFLVRFIPAKNFLFYVFFRVS